MPLDVELSEVNAGGVAEPKADWSDQARGNMTAALRDIMAGRRANVVVFDGNRLSPGASARFAPKAVFKKVNAGFQKQTSC